MGVRAYKALILVHQKGQQGGGMRLAIVVWEAAPLGILNDGFLVLGPTARGGGALKLWLETSGFRTARFDYQRHALVGYGRSHGLESLTAQYGGQIEVIPDNQTTGQLCRSEMLNSVACSISYAQD